MALETCSHLRPRVLRRISDGGTYVVCTDCWIAIPISEEELEEIFSDLPLSEIAEAFDA